MYSVAFSVWHRVSTPYCSIAVFGDFFGDITVFGKFFCGIAVFKIPQCPPLLRFSLERTQTGFGKLWPATASARLLNNNPSYEIMREVLSRGGATPLIWIHVR